MQETAKKSINPEISTSQISLEENNPPILTRILREPLVHFLVLGALLFGLYFWVNDNAYIKSTSSKEIQVSAAVIESLKSDWQRQWGRTPDAENLEKLVDRYVRDEILYQEALALGLDYQDTIVRRRMIQKMQFLTEGVAPVKEPSDEVLAAYLAENAYRYEIPAKFSFSQIYFSKNSRGDDAETDAQDLLNQLQSNPDMESSELGGDPFMLRKSYNLASIETLAKNFGQPFGEEISAITETGWQGPIHSVYGSHLVNVTEIEPSHAASLEEVKRDVRLDWLREKRLELDEKFYQQIRDRYLVSMDEEALNQGVEEEDS